MLPDRPDLPVLVLIDFDQYTHTPKERLRWLTSACPAVVLISGWNFFAP